jgi:DNA (cytosine-5)-methyltransferase 1
VTVGSLCSGIGGLEKGVELARPDAEVVWQAECDPFCLDILAKHWPSAHRYTDVRDVDGKAARVDLVCGGFPCQPHSLAGKRQGTSDARWLWPEFARIIAAVRPGAVFIENVPGLRTSGLRDVLADLARLGFDAEWDYFTAAETGAPHIRRRLFILAYADSFRGRPQPGWAGGADWADTVVTGGDGATWVATYANGPRELQPERIVADQWGWSRDGNGWSPVPPVCGVDDGTPERVDREKALGNAVVPQQAALAWRELTERIGE